MSLNVNYDRFRPKASAFFAGRVWYSGIPSGEKLGWVMFSQVLDDIGNVDKCYQANDPTSEAFSDIQDSDGGIIQIPDAGEIVSLVPQSRSLFVFAANGVWQIIGGDNGFTAANYSVEKISNVGCLFQKSIVIAEETIFYWSSSGIYQLTIDTTGLTASVKNISDQNIKTFYQNIPTVNKLHVQGKYNDSDKIIHWAYYSGDIGEGNENRFRKNRILALNLQLGAFYTYTFADNAGVYITAFAVTRETVESTSTFDVVVNTDNVQVSTDDVVANLPIVQGARKQFKYLCFYPSNLFFYNETWADLLGTGFKDWFTYNNTGTAVDSYVITGYNVGGNGPARNKTASYVHMFMKRTETGFDENTGPINPSSILMQTRWDFTDNSNPGKWSGNVQVYRQPRPFFVNPFAQFDDGYPLVISKNKVRGRGKALQIKLQAEGDNDMQITGWSIGFVNNTNI